MKIFNMQCTIPAPQTETLQFGHYLLPCDIYIKYFLFYIIKYHKESSPGSDACSLQKFSHVLHTPFSFEKLLSEYL